MGLYHPIIISLYLCIKFNLSSWIAATLFINFDLMSTGSTWPLIIFLYLKPNEFIDIQWINLLYLAYFSFKNNSKSYKFC